MDKRSLTTELKNYAGAHFISRSKLAAFLGYKEQRQVSPILHGLARVGTKYYIPDIAERLMDISEVQE